MDNKALQQMDSRARCVQAQMEGLFRQLYQGCTQQAIVPSFRIYNAMAEMAAELFNSLSAMIEDYDRLMREENQEDKTLN
jgi:hypothetical protein